MPPWKNVLVCVLVRVVVCVLVCVLAAGWAATAGFLVFRTPEIPAPVIVEVPAPPEPEPPALPETPSLLRGRLEDALASVRAGAGFAGAAIGLTVLDADGEVFFSDGGETALIPASTLKTVTAATALEQLGPDFTFTTEVRAATKPDAEGTLAGDLALVGGGDPTLSSADLTALAMKVRVAGVTRITGRILADARIFPEQIASDFWNWGDIGNGYGSSAAGLNLNHNRFVAVFAPGPTRGAPTEFLGAGVELPGVEWINRVTTGAPNSGDGVMLYTSPQSDSIFCFGTIPSNEPKFGVTGAVPDPPRYAAAAFLAALQAKRITVTGKAEVIPATETAKPPAEILATHASAPLRVIVRHLLEVSDNHEAECLFRFLARKHGKPGEQVIREHWAARGLTFQGLRMEDGSGLARADFIRPLDMARLLHLVLHGEQGGIFHDSLNAHFENNVRWKGGAMSAIRSWTGYVRRDDGEWTFALIFNHFGGTTDTAGARDALLRVLLRKD